MNYDELHEAPRKSSLLSGCLIGCLASVVLMIVVVGAGSWFAFTKGPALIARFARQGIAEAMQETDLPEDQQKRILEQVDRVVNAVIDGRVTMDDFQATVQQVSESPLVGLIAVAALEAKYLNDSGLSDEEKAEATLTIRRVMRGVMDEKIQPEQLESAMEVIAERQGDNEWRLRNRVTDDELRDFLAQCKAVADEAGVEVDPAPVDLADEVRKLVDQLLGEGEFASGDPASGDPASGDPASQPSPPADPVEIDGAVPAETSDFDTSS